MNTSKISKTTRKLRCAKRIFFYLFLSGCLGISSFVRAQSISTSATAGKEFYVSFLDNGAATPEKLLLKVVVEKPCRITAQYNNTNAYYWNNTPFAPGIYTAEVSYDDMVGTGTGITSKTMTVTSTEDISVYAIYHAAASTDATVILPVSAWGSTYLPATGKPATGHGTAYSVVAKEDNTNITLLHDNVQLISLNKNEVYHFYALSGKDLTGTMVFSTSGKPIAVFSGAPLTAGASGNNYGTPLSTGSDDHGYEQMWSIDKWGNDFFVWPAGDAANVEGIIGIVALQSGTQVTVSGGISGGPLSYNNMTTGDKEYICGISGLTRVTSNNPIMVFTVLPDASVTYIPPTKNRVTRAVLSPFNLTDHAYTNITTHVAEMLIPARHWNRTEIRENGGIVSNATWTVTPSADFPDWYTVRKNVNATDRIDVSCPGGLLAYMYGFGDDESYGYLAGAGAYDFIDLPDLPDNVVETDCAVPVTAMNWSINTSPIQLGNNNISVYQTPYVGDLDNDGHVEIVVAGNYTGDSTVNWAYSTTKIHVFDRGNYTSQQITVPKFATAGRGQIGLAKPNATSNGYIVVAAMDQYLYAYNKTGGQQWVQQWKSNKLYTTYTGSNPTGYISGNIMFSDFNGDGNTEIVTGDRIFDLEKGKLLLDCRFLNGNKNINTPCVSVIDVTGDGKPELVWGGNVYSIVITNPSDSTGNSYTRITQVTDVDALTGLPNDLVTATIPADFDLDGQVDILAYGKSYFYVYDPLSGNVKVKHSILAADQGEGTPFVGDIDGDKYPEIMYGESPSPNYYIVALDIDVAAGTANLKWRKKTTDESQYTGLTLFDFDQNETFEILYRDHDSLRIFNGYDQNSMNVAVASIPCLSYTQGEYPVIADVDNDGEAEIVVTGSPKNGDMKKGYVFIFNPGPGARWAPARKVWNQYAYNVVNIKEDLTVPKKMFNIATIMAGPDSIVGTWDDIQPFNGFLKQATRIDQFGNMVMYAPDVRLAGNPVFTYGAPTSGDSLRIVYTVFNAGTSGFQLPLPVSLYRNNATVPAIFSKSISPAGMETLNPGALLTDTIVIYNFSTQYSLNDILILRLNDNGSGNGNEQSECNTANNTFGIQLLDLLLQTRSDTRTVQQYYWTEIDVLANDILPDALFAGSFSLLDSVMPEHRPAAGTLSVTGTGRNSRLIYQNNGMDGLTDHIDSLVYRFRINPGTGNVREVRATVYIYILEETHGASTCSDRSFTATLRGPSGVNFRWYAGTTLGDTTVCFHAGASYPFGTLTTSRPWQWQVRPVNVTGATVPSNLADSFPPAWLTVHVTDASAPHPMRWTGLKDSLWHNPENWVETVTANGQTYETPVSWSPSACTNVVITSGVPHYPALVDSAWCNNILVQDRALLA
ncbi:MAG: hypothetical protein LBR86_05015, partial [Tannerella sp.]|nr:hypothetical protein [Tannerella sp.]